MTKLTDDEITTKVHKIINEWVDEQIDLSDTLKIATNVLERTQNACIIMGMFNVEMANRKEESHE